jgi:hypothetical protein
VRNRLLWVYWAFVWAWIGEMVIRIGKNQLKMVKKGKKKTKRLKRGIL